MIILVDNHNYALRLCKDNKKYAYVSTTQDQWKFTMKVLSDIDVRVVVDEKEIEDYLDEHNIYYIHVEHIEKENFERFTKRMEKMIEERQHLIDTNQSTEKLIFGITRDGSTKATYKTDNVFYIIREHCNNEYSTYFELDEKLPVKERVAILKGWEKKLVEHFGEVPYGVEEDDFYMDVNFSSGKSIQELVAKFHMYIAVVEASTLHK